MAPATPSKAASYLPPPISPSKPSFSLPELTQLALPSFTSSNKLLTTYPDPLPIAQASPLLANNNSFEANKLLFGPTNPFQKSSPPKVTPSKSNSPENPLADCLDVLNSPYFSGNDATSKNLFINPPAYIKEGQDQLLKQSRSFPYDFNTLMQSSNENSKRDAKKFGDTVMYGAEKLFSGAVVSPLEALADITAVPAYSLLSLITSAGGPLRNNVSDFFASQAKKFATDDFSGKYNTSIDERYKDVDSWGKIGGNISQVGGEVLSLFTPATIAKAVVGANNVLQTSKFANGIYKHITNAIISINNGGKAMEQAAIEGADVNQSIIHGLTMGGFESATQVLSGGLPYMPKGRLSEFLKNSTNIPAVKTLIDVVGEGGEGALRTFFEPIAKRIIYNPEQSLATPKELWTSFLQDSAGSLALQAFTQQLDLRTKNRNADSKAQMYIDKGSQKAEAAEDMPEVNRAFGPSYSNSKAERELLTNSIDRGANKLYNSLENGADFPLFSQQTRNEFAVAIAEATNKTVFKEQLNMIKNVFGEDSESFINGICEDILNDIGLDLLKGGKTSALGIQNKISNSFTKAVQITQEYKQGLDFDVSDIKVEPGTLYEKNKASFKEYSMPKNIKIVNGLVGGKIPVEEFQALRQFSIKNPAATMATLGKYFTAENSYIAKAGKDSSYFDLGLTVWDETKDKYNLTPDEMFEYFNVPFLDDVIASNKTIRFSHDPITSDGFLLQEWDYIKEQLNITDNNLFKEGDFWYVR